MPRPLVSGNQCLLVQSDETGTIRDLFWPYVGLYNHINGSRVRMGFWVDGAFAWLDDEGWSRELGPQSAELRNEHLGLVVSWQDTAHPTFPLFERRMILASLREEPRDLRLFVSPDTRICESDMGDTVLYHPGLQSMVHFKRDIWLSFSLRDETGPVIDQYNTGYKAFRDFVGTYLDAEDGELGMKPIEQGSVDSVFRARWPDFQGEQEVTFRIEAASSFEELGRAVGKWAGESPGIPSQAIRLEVKMQEFLRESIRIVLTQTDAGGAILAANDSDILRENRATYSYCWPRDGAIVAVAMLRAGYPEVLANYLSFCEPLLSEDQPVFHQKYAPDGTVGATWHPYIVDGKLIRPFQQDETALTIWALEQMARAFPTDPRLGEWTEQLVRIPSDFMLEVRDANGLPLPSWDLWEERRGVHAHTVATVVRAFRSAAFLMDQVGDRGRATSYRQASDKMLAAWNARGWNAERQAYYRMLTPTPAGYEGDPTIDAAVLAFDELGLSSEMPQFEMALQTMRDRLAVRTSTGGFARYENDYYFRQTEAAPGNPWIITTMWFARAAMRRREPGAADWLHWALRHAASSDVLSEQLHPETGAPLSVSPLTWSHAEVIETILLALS